MTIRNPLIERLHRQTGLAGDDLHALAQACGTVRDFRAHTDISPQEAHPDYLHILLKGWAARYVLASDGRRQVPALLLPGDVCDLDGLTLRRAHTGVCAFTHCTVAIVSCVQLRALMNQRPAIRDAFWFLQGVQSAAATEWIIGFGRRSADERMAHLLCELNARLSAVDLSTNNAFEFPLTQADLADVLGLSPVHVNRTLQFLRARLTFTWEHRWLTIHNLQALAELSDFRPDYLHLNGWLPVAGVSSNSRRQCPGQVGASHKAGVSQPLPAFSTADH